MISNTKKIKNKLAKRYAKEKRFQIYGLGAIVISIAFLLSLLINISTTGFPAFQQTYINIDVDIDSKLLNLDGKYSEQALFSANYRKVINQSLKTLFPGVEDRRQKRALRQLISKSARYQLRDFVMNNPDTINTKQSVWFLARDALSTMSQSLHL
jgi:phosphate transport system permease protein